MTAAAPASLMVFWDYDTQWGADRSRLAGGAKGWGALEFTCTERLLEIHGEAGVPACFAVVGAAARAGERPYHDPAQIRRISAAGHEVASHSFYHEWLPALGPAALRQDLRESKAALEDCIGAEVSAFVPPYNQPFDYPQGLALSLAERRAVGRGRTDLRGLCVALRETGYRFCRVAFRSLPHRLAEGVLRRRLDRPGRPFPIAGVTCVRLNAPGGFGPGSLAMLERCADRGGLLAVYGHPHSLHAGGAQDESLLVPFLRRAGELRAAGRLRVVLPRDLLQAECHAPVSHLL